MDAMQEYYIQTAPKKVAGLQEMLDADNRDELGKRLHKIAGSAGGFGYEQLSQSARQAETVAKADAGAPIDEQLQKLVQSVIALLQNLS